MDDEEVELSHGTTQPNPHSSCSLRNSTNADSVLKNNVETAQTCTHTHTCNPPDREALHTHTCYHTHTQVIASEGADVAYHKNKRRASLKVGNKEAVRKYREKKKVYAAYLEEEVKKLRLLNQQLLRKLQGQKNLEAEVSRLRSLLLDLKRKIDGELGISSFQMQCSLGSATTSNEAATKHRLAGLLSKDNTGDGWRRNCFLRGKEKLLV